MEDELVNGRLRWVLAERACLSADGLAILTERVGGRGRTGETTGGSSRSRCRSFPSLFLSNHSPPRMLSLKSALLGLALSALVVRGARETREEAGASPSRGASSSESNCPS